MVVAHLYTHRFCLEELLQQIASSALKLVWMPYRKGVMQLMLQLLPCSACVL